MRYRLPSQLEPAPFATALTALPSELQYRIFAYLDTDDLGLLARVVPELLGLDEEVYLQKLWLKHTAPARIDFALFSPIHGRPDPEELVRKGHIRGIAIISGIRSRGYWASESAVRLSRIHATLQSTHIRQTLSTSLSPSHRPPPADLYAKRILPSPSLITSPSISAKAYLLERQLSRHLIRRTLSTGMVGRSFMDGLSALGDVAGMWEEGERVRWAICPGIRGTKRFWEEEAFRPARLGAGVPGALPLAV